MEPKFFVAVLGASNEWSPERFIQWAEKSGPATAKLITEVHPEQSYRSCLGILRLGKSYGDSRLEAACQRALTLGTYAVRSIESILKHRLDEQPLGKTEELALPLDHDNIRNADILVMPRGPPIAVTRRTSHNAISA